MSGLAYSGRSAAERAQGSETHLDQLFDRLVADLRLTGGKLARSWARGAQRQSG